MKLKYIVWGLLMSLIMTWTAIPLPALASHSVGSTVKDQSGVVYFITSDGTRRPYTSAGAFLSYGFNSWKNVTTADAEDMQLPQGPFIPPQDGKIMCSDRGETKGTCYVMSSGNKLAFESESIFRSQGFNFNNSLNGDVSFVATGQSVADANSAHSPGTLIKKDGTVYLVSENGLFGIPNQAIFKSWGFSFADVVTANSADGGPNFSVIDNLQTRQPGQLSPLPASTYNIQPITNQESYPSAVLNSYEVKSSYTAGAKSVTIFSATIHAPTTAEINISNLDFSFGPSSSPPLTNIKVIAYNPSYKELTSLSATQTSNVGFGFPTITVPIGNSMDILVKADINSNAGGTLFWVNLDKISDGAKNLSTSGLPLWGNSISISEASTLGPITAPGAGEALQAGQSYTIKWQKNGNASGTVDVVAVSVKQNCQATKSSEIYDCLTSTYSASDVREISSSAPNTGTLSWTVPSDWPSSQPYAMIFIGSNTDNAVEAFSKVFTIHSTSPSITVTAPAGSTYKPGDSVNVTWTSANIPSGILIRDVFLTDSYNKETYLTSDLPNTGSAQVTLPSVLTGEKYQIKLRTVVNGTIVTSATDGNITISTNAYSSRDSKRMSDVRQLASALELYFNDFSKYPDTLQTMTPTYIGVIPTAPTPQDGICSTSQNSYNYTSLSNGQNYTLTFCLGGVTGGYTAGTHTLSSAGIQ